ncbi:MAG: protein phosphatase CheZ [Nitrospirota bacterium]
MPDEKESHGIKELVEVARAMSEGDFYRELSVTVKGELAQLAEYINKTRVSLQHLEPSVRETTKNIPMASQQLSDVTRATEEATHKVLSLTEEILDEQESLGKHLAAARGAASAPGGDGLLPALDAINATTDRTKEKLIEIMTNLSFQDLTGQKIKKIVALVQEVEAKILELILSFGLRPDEKGNDTDRQKRVEMIGQLHDAYLKSEIKQDLVDDILKSAGIGR